MMMIVVTNLVINLYNSKKNSYICNIMLKTDLKQFEGMYYIGDIVDVDGDGWVDEETAELILLEHNAGVTE